MKKWLRLASILNGRQKMPQKLFLLTLSIYSFIVFFEKLRVEDKTFKHSLNENTQALKVQCGEVYSIDVFVMMGVQKISLSITF